MLKNDGTVALRRQIGDTVRLLGPPKAGETSPREPGLIVFIGRVDPQIELWDRRDMSMLYVIDRKVPGLGGISVNELRSIVSRISTPNKPPEATPGQRPPTSPSRSSGAPQF